MKIIQFIFRLAVLLFLFASCGGKTKVSEESAFERYISAYTSGQVSKFATIRVMLVAGVPDVEAGQEITEKVFDFSPSIKGTTSWLDNRTIELNITSR